MIWTTENLDEGQHSRAVLEVGPAELGDMSLPKFSQNTSNVWLVLGYDRERALRNLGNNWRFLDILQTYHCTLTNTSSAESSITVGSRK